MNISSTLNHMTDSYAAIDNILRDSSHLTSGEFDYLQKVQTNVALIMARLMTKMKEDGYVQVSIPG